GAPLSQDSVAAEISPRKSQKIRTVDLNSVIQKVGANNLLAWLKLEVEGKTVSENLISLVPPKEMKLVNPKVRWTVTKAHEGFLVMLKAEKPPLWVWLELENEDAKYSDNFVHLTSGVSTQILVHPKKRLGKSEFERALRVRSLFDTYV